MRVDSNWTTVSLGSAGVVAGTASSRSLWRPRRKEPAMARYTWATIGLLVAGIGITACGDDGHGRDDYVAVLSGTADGFSEDEADCIAEALVDVVSVEELETAGAWDRIQDNPNGTLSDFGITLDEAQSSTFFDGMNQCKDMRAFFEETLTTEGLSPELSACVIDGIDDATLQSIIMVSFTQGDAGLEADAELTTAVEQAATECATAGVA
jgi:hypothetical protein